MKRIEIISNRSIEEDLFDSFKKALIVKKYTKIPIVYGVGHSEPKMGDHIWPEENFLLIIYCDEIEAQEIKKIVSQIKENFQDEGLKLFEMSVDCCL